MKNDPKAELLADIIKAQRELETAKQNYEYVSSSDLIEMYAYKIIAARVKCDYLIKKAKAMGVNSFSQAQDTRFRRFQR